MRLLALRPVASSIWLILLSGVSSSLYGQAAATPASTASIFTCIDDRGRKLTADRLIPDCTAREQRELNQDGSLRRVHPPILTVDEKAERDARERRMAETKAALAEAVRRDRNLLARFPNEASHRKAREAALDTVRAAVKSRDSRLSELAAERQPLMAEAEFYKGRALPAKLRIQIDANDAATDAQRESAKSLEAEFDRVNSLYDSELARLNRLWAGAVPGSLGPLPNERVPSAVASSASSVKAANLR
jgi:hypothetical protein